MLALQLHRQSDRKEIIMQLINHQASLSLHVRVVVAWLGGWLVSWSVSWLDGQLVGWLVG